MSSLIPPFPPPPAPARPSSGLGLRSVLLSTLLSALLSLAPTPSRAAETDQLSGRLYDAPDSSAIVNAYVNQRLEEARARTERRMQPDWTDDKLARVLRRQLYREFPFDARHFGTPMETWMSHELAFQGYAVETRGPGTGWRFSIYDEYRAAFRMRWRDDFPMASIVFFGSSLFLDTLVAPTFITNDIRYGSDKWSHFFRLGYRYYTHSEDGTNVARALAYGMKTERGTVGYRTSGAVSYADLASNHAGYLFFATLLQGERPYFLREGERLTQIRPFQAEDWVAESWDEYLNPNVYRPHTLAVIDLHLTKHQPMICAEYALWRDTRGGPRAPLQPISEYVNPDDVWPQVDPWRLDERCGQE